MSRVERTPDEVDVILELLDRVKRLERRRGAPHVTTATRPAAADARGMIVFNTDTSRHQGSNGTTWNDLY